MCSFMLLAGCGATPKTKTTTIPEVAFSGDSAYAYVAGQVAFGSRVPGSDAHNLCLQYLGSTLERFGAKVEIQTGEVQRYDGAWQRVANICAHLAADSAHANEKAILLCAHYDSRPWADQEEDYSERMIPIPGANDGASGVGVLMEVARQLGIRLADSCLTTPVDIILFDVEDSGTPRFYTGLEREDTWCLGSQLWGKQYAQQITDQQSPITNPQYRFGIVLDMVGAPDASFPREMYSSRYAANYQQQIWRSAEQLGYGVLFNNQQSYPITDDHYYINVLTGIPCVDIIHYDIRNATGFASWWHTRNDNMDNISKATLQAVGEVVMMQL